MAAPSYTEDLTDIDLAESGSTGVAVNYSGGGGAAPAFGADLGMQGLGCWDRQVSSHERGVVFNQTPGSGTTATDVHIFQWGFVATPGITDVLATRGAFVIIGTGTGANVQFHVEGSDTYGAAGRVGKCYPIRYVTTANTGSVPYRTVTGSPGATPTYFGFGMKTIASAKGSNLGVDAVRYGTGAYITAGEVANPATFDGFATVNDYNDATNGYNRWGILTKVGAAYELQGRFVIGQNNSGTATLAYFDDSDRTISLVDTVHSTTTFTQIIIDHASTTCKFTNISITALGTHNPGRFVVNNASSTVEVTGGTWTSIGISTLRAGCTMDGLTWRLTDAITLNGATVENCTIDRNTATSAMVTTTGNMANVTGNTFISDGTGHAVNIGSVAATTSFTWDNFLSGYVAGTSGSPVTTGTSGNEAILCNVSSGQTLTINVADGATTPSVKNDGTGTVNVVAGQKTFTVNVSPVPTPDYEYRLYEVTAVGSMAGATEITAEGEEHATTGSHAYTHSETNQPVAVQIISNDYIEQISYYTLTAANLTVTINLTVDDND